MQQHVATTVPTPNALPAPGSSGRGSGDSAGGKTKLSGVVSGGSLVGGVFIAACELEAAAVQCSGVQQAQRRLDRKSSRDAEMAQLREAERELGSHLHTSKDRPRRELSASRRARKPAYVLQVGDRIKHAKRGEGLVAEILPDGRVRIVFDEGEEHRYHPSSHSKLSKLKEEGGPSSSSSSSGVAVSSSADGAGVGVGGVGAAGVVDGQIVRRTTTTTTTTSTTTVEEEVQQLPAGASTAEKMRSPSEEARARRRSSFDGATGGGDGGKRRVSFDGNEGFGAPRPGELTLSAAAPAAAEAAAPGAYMPPGAKLARSNSYLGSHGGAFSPGHSKDHPGRRSFCDKPDEHNVAPSRRSFGKVALSFGALDAAAANAFAAATKSDAGAASGGGGVQASPPPSPPPTPPPPPPAVEVPPRCLRLGRLAHVASRPTHIRRSAALLPSPPCSPPPRPPEPSEPLPAPAPAAAPAGASASIRSRRMSSAKLGHHDAAELERHDSCSWAAASGAIKVENQLLNAAQQRRQERLAKRRSELDDGVTDDANARGTKERPGRQVYTEERKQAAAMRIQAHAWGRAVRGKLQLRLHAATLIQAHTRGKLVRQATEPELSVRRSSAGLRVGALVGVGFGTGGAPAPAAAGLTEEEKAAAAAARARKRDEMAAAHKTRRASISENPPRGSQRLPTLGGAVTEGDEDLLSRAERCARARDARRSSVAERPLPVKGSSADGFVGASADEIDGVAASAGGGSGLSVAEINRLAAAAAAVTPGMACGGGGGGCGGCGGAISTDEIVIDASGFATGGGAMAGTILGRSGPETGWSRGNKWKRMEVAKDQIIMTRRWHTDVDAWYKRMWISCKNSHTLLAGLVYRGTQGMSRAQTVQILMNSIALEIVVLCMQYSESSTTLTLNLVYVLVSGTFGALISIPAMTLFAAAFHPQIIVNLMRWLVPLICGCPGRLWRNRVKLARAAFCWPCAAYREALHLLHVAEEKRHALSRRLSVSRGRLKSQTSSKASSLRNDKTREDDSRKDSNGRDGKKTKAKRRKVTAVEVYRARMAEIEKAAVTPARLPAPGGAGMPPRPQAQAGASPSAASAAPLTKPTAKAEMQAQALRDAYKKEAAAFTKEASDRSSGEKKKKKKVKLPQKRSSRYTTGGLLDRSSFSTPRGDAKDPDADPYDVAGNGAEGDGTGDELAKFERQFVYASLNEHLVRLSLSRALRNCDWRRALQITLGWLINYLLFAFLLVVYIVYGCVFESLSAEDNSEAFFWSWMWSLAQRFVAMEPLIILFGALVPVLFASQACANLCTESCNNFLGIGFAVCITFMKRLKKF